MDAARGSEVVGTNFADVLQSFPPAPREGYPPGIKDRTLFNILGACVLLAALIGAVGLGLSRGVALGPAHAVAGVMALLVVASVGGNVVRRRRRRAIWREGTAVAGKVLSCKAVRSRRDGSHYRVQFEYTAQNGSRLRGHARLVFKMAEGADVVVLHARERPDRSLPFDGVVARRFLS